MKNALTVYALCTWKAMTDSVYGMTRSNLNEGRKGGGRERGGSNFLITLAQTLCLIAGGLHRLSYRLLV